MSDERIPGRMHVKSLARDGTPAWSSQFLKFIGDIIPPGTYVELHRWQWWWTEPYVVERLKARFGARIIEALIELERQQTQAHFVAPRHHVSVTHLERVQRRAGRAIRRDYLPYAHKPRW